MRTRLVSAGLSGLMLIVAGGAAASHAAEFTISADPLDYEAQDVGATSNGVSGSLRVGSRTLNTSATPTAVSAVLPFALPEIPAGEEIATAQLSVLTLAATSNLPVANADLYGMGFNAAPLEQDVVYFAGGDDTTAGVTKLEDDFLIPADATVSERFLSADIGDYIQSLYTAGAAAGDFAVLRLSYDQSVNLDVHNRYLFRSRQATSASDNPLEQHPYLIITTAPTVPEPGALATALVGGAALLARRRRR